MKKVILVLSLLFVPLLASASFDSNLYYGLQNNNSVKEMQEFLSDQEVYSGPITGNFYSLTLKAVKDFQRKENISPASGFFGPLTRIRANEILSANVEPSNQQAVQETGSTPPPAESAKTTNDVVKSLQDQIALLLQQVTLLQSQQQNVQQIQQNTQQIAQNTTPSVKGCTKSSATNYNPSAVEDDGSCTYSAPTCTLTAERTSNTTGKLIWTSTNADYGNLYKKTGTEYSLSFALNPLSAGQSNLTISTAAPSHFKAKFGGRGGTIECAAAVEALACQDSALQASLASNTPASANISKNYAGYSGFTAIRLSSVGGTEDRYIDKIIITREGGTDEMFPSVSLQDGIVIASAGGNLARGTFENGKVEFRIPNLTIRNGSERYFTILAQLNPEKAVPGTSVRIGIMTGSDITIRNMCDSATSNASISGSLMGNYMTIGE